MELMDPFGPALGGGDCVDLSVLSIDPPLGADVEPEVPSEVWMFRLAGGKPEAGGAFRLLLNRKDIVGSLCELLTGHYIVRGMSRFMRLDGSRGDDSGCEAG